MMRLANKPASLAVASLVGVFVSSAYADLPNDIRSSPNAQQYRSQIDVYVKAHVAKITGGDNKAISTSRDELAKQCDTTPSFTPSGSFQLTYCESVIAALEPVLKDTDAGKRLQAAIILSRLASATQSLTLQAPVLTLLQDPSTAVALWGVKAAGALLPPVLQQASTARSEKLTTAIAKAVETHGSSGPLIQDAYRALDVSEVKPPLAAASISRTTDAINAIVAFRVTQWVNGVPVEPRADRDPTNYYWKVVKSNSVKQNQQAVQNLVNLLAVSAARMAPLGGQERDRIANVGAFAAGSLLNIFNDKPAVVAAFKPFQRLGGMSPVDVQSALKAGVAELKKLPDYASLIDPPQVKPLDQSAAGN